MMSRAVASGGKGGRPDPNYSFSSISIFVKYFELNRRDLCDIFTLSLGVEIGVIWGKLWNPVYRRQDAGPGPKV